MPKKNVQLKFGEAVRIWRTQLGVSQEDLADRAGLHRTYVCDVEGGRRNVSLQSIEKLADALAISVSNLFPLSAFPHGKTDAANNGQGKDFVEILLIEDNKDDAELAQWAFHEARFANHVNVVRDGAQALDYVFCRGIYAGRSPGKNPQIILLDLNLPNLDGLEVLRRIKADKRTRKIPVIILTASQKDKDIAECRRLGAKSYIVKPLDFQSLSRATPQFNLIWALLKPAGKNGRTAKHDSWG